MSREDSVYHRLDAHQIAYTLYQHPAVFTVQESHDLDLQIPAAHTKNLFLISKKDPSRCFLICLSADKKLRINEFSRQHGLKDLTFGSPELMQQILGVTPGSVTLFGIIHYRQQVQRAQQKQDQQKQDQKEQKSDTLPRLEVFIDRELREADAV